MCNINKKQKGQVFTPNWIVNEMINLCNIKDITKIKIIDNSCGEGAFILEIVKRIIEQNPKNLKNILENNVVGIELDYQAFSKCLHNLKMLEKEYHLSNINWNIKNSNTLNIYKEYENMFDIVIGNPPYVRIHNTIENLENFDFCKKGMTDLFLAFYEVSLKMLKNTGKLCFINPSSLFNSNASSIARNYIIKNCLLTKVVNFKHYQLFERINTYSTIILLDKNNKKSEIKYYEYNFRNSTKIHYDDFVINNSWYFDKSISKLNTFKKIINNKKEKIKVKNGIATLCDSVFINDALPKCEYTINIVKGSTLKETKTLFLYDEYFNPLMLEKIPNNVKEYLFQNKDKLQKRDLENKNFWWVYGRTQGIKDKNNLKLCINTIIKDIDSIKTKIIDPGTLIYSGLYLNINNLEEAKKIKKIICSENFINYIEIIGKYKSGGYYTFSSKELSKYINYYF